MITISITCGFNPQKHMSFVFEGILYSKSFHLLINIFLFFRFSAHYGNHYLRSPVPPSINHQGVGGAGGVAGAPSHYSTFSPHGSSSPIPQENCHTISIDYFNQLLYVCTNDFAHSILSFFVRTRGGLDLVWKMKQPETIPRLV